MISFFRVIKSPISFLERYNSIYKYQIFVMGNYNIIIEFNSLNPRLIKLYLYQEKILFFP